MTTVSRLIEYFVPTHYNLRLKLERVDRRFSGIVTINGNSVSPDKPIKLHSKELDIRSVTIDGHETSVEYGDNDEITIKSDNLSVGDHVIVVEFDGKIVDQSMHGLYPCYFEVDGVKKELLATQFESHHAREVFPCIDEPEAKATFDLTLDTEKGVSVLGNMPIKAQSESNDGRLVTTFETSPRMSTYLLAFVVGELQKKSGKTKTGVDVSVYATPVHPADSLDFALDYSIRLLEFYEDYFDIPYPLPKCDHVALPDFSSGAMENWGLITYREVALLAEPGVTSISGKRRIAEVIAHELAHQWFGNLVTMKWWDDLWLNESFAEMMMHFSIDELEPEWNTWLDFSSHIVVSALRRDCVDGVQPVKMDVGHPDEMNTIFDPSIVYAKGSRLIRMVKRYIGDEAFRKGLSQYFADFAYKNTVGNDLWDALGKASGKDIRDMMNIWLTQPGYPVVLISRDGDTVTLEQKRFFVGPHAKDDSLWPIPLDSDNDKVPALLDKKKVSFTCADPIRLNISDSSHFITSYDEQSQQAIIESIEKNELPAVGRLQRLNEITLLARGGIISSDQLLPIVKAFHNEPLESVWTTVSLTLAELRKFVEDNEQAEKKLRAFSAALARAEYERLGWTQKPGESEEDTRLRSTILGLTLYGEQPEVIEKAREIYNTTPLDELDPEIRPVILSTIVRHGDAQIVDQLLDLYTKTTTAELREDICIGMTSTRVPEKINMLLESIKNPEIVRVQDVYHWFAFLIRGKDSRDTSWRWVRDNWDWVVQTFKGDKSYDDIPRYSASALSTRKQLKEYEEFFGPKKSEPALTRTIELGIREIEGRVELIERDKDAVQRALLSES